MSHAVIDGNGMVRQLDRKAEPDEQITDYEVNEVGRLARLVMSIRRDLNALRRRWAPRIIDSAPTQVDDTGTTVYRFPHGFGTRVNWWPIDCVDGDGVFLARHASSDDNTLALTSSLAATVRIRIEEAG